MLAWSLGLAQFWAFWYSPRDYANFFFHNSRDATTTTQVDRTVLAKILNHNDDHQTATYDHYSYLKEKRQALDMWG
jgi:hypothetical protein